MRNFVLWNLGVSGSPQKGCNIPITGTKRKKDSFFIHAQLPSCRSKILIRGLEVVDRTIRHVQLLLVVQRLDVNGGD
jgi:hypothetical protein